MSFYKTKHQIKFEESPFKNKAKPIEEENIKFSPEVQKIRYENFLKDWRKIRKRHEGQKAILKAIFKDHKTQVFMRMGRKAAKTTTNIDIAWRMAHLYPRSMTYICCPTVSQGADIYWDEKRLQWCDLDNPMMAEKYVKTIDNKSYMLHMNNGSMIKLVGTWNEARSRGTQPNCFIADEVQDNSPEYLDAANPNLMAKSNTIWIMSGTPPKKRNHYHEWEERIRNHPKGFCVHYSSYINTSLPHLKDDLDRKRIELIKAGKEDEWLREYMAEDSFRSDDRVLPDISPVEFDSLLSLLKSVDAQAYEPIFGLYISEHQITANFNVRLFSRYTGTQIYTLETFHTKRLWDRSYAEIYGQMNEKMQEYSTIFKRPWRKVLLDETNSFSDVIPGMTFAKKEKDWIKRGIPLMKEMILSKKLTISNRAPEMAIQSQNLLKEDDARDYPSICCSAMIVNEFYQAPMLSREEQVEWDRLAPLREAGIVTTPKRSNKLKPYRGKWA